MLRESTRERERVFDRAGVGSAFQALWNSWSICPCLRPLCNKKNRAEGEKGLNRVWGKQQIADASIGEGSL